ncbi:Uncharacterised protein [Vibrio cholerae]|nr:Uncharacterised protein [Vibrio cholerae]
MRYKIAQSVSVPPCSCQPLILLTTKRASSSSLYAEYTEMGSPTKPSVHSCLPIRSLLLAISVFEASKMVLVER